MNLAWSRTAEQRRSRTTLDLDRLDDELATIAAGSHFPAIDRRELAHISTDYRSDQEGYAALRYSRILYRHPDIDFIAHRRRDHYRQWSTAAMNLPYCHPLHPTLPENCIPYMFPLYINQPEPHFYWLKQLGLPLYRWDSIAVSDCPTAGDYRLHLLQLPCHQSLTERDMDWMIAAVRKVGVGGTALNHLCP
jgi:hypothetical protein